MDFATFHNDFEFICQKCKIKHILAKGQLVKPSLWIDATTTTLGVGHKI